MSAQSTPSDVTAQDPAAKPPAAKPRIAFWDNARFILIVLVVIGHAISTVRTDSSLGFALYAYIYLFHMPAMILLSGLFSRAEMSPKIIKSTLQLIVTWVVWEGIWAFIHFAVEDQLPGDRFLVSPAWTLWFLVTLATMRILLPYIARLRYPLTFSIILALGSGLLPSIGTEFSASRTLAFLPFFVLGWMIRDRGLLEGQWFLVPFRGVKLAAWALLGAIALVFVLAPNFRDFWRIDKWLTWRDDYDWLFRNAVLGEWIPGTWVGVASGGIAVTALLLAIAAAMTLALLIVTPRKQSLMTVWGSRTLYVYLLHGPIIWTLRMLDVVEWADSFGTIGLVGVVVFAIGLAIFLSSAWVSRLFRPIIEPTFDWIMKKG